MRTADACHELFLNYACNAKCAFCYNPPLTPELLRLELSYEQALRSLYDGARTGAKRLNLHGGEVTLRDDLPRILLAARRLGYEQITVVTNGVRLAHAGYVRELLACGATHIRLSVHGPDARTHDDVVAIPGAFAKVLRAIEHLRAAGTPLGLNFVLIRGNYRSLPAFLELFCLKLGLEDVIVYFPHLRGMMAINAEREGVTYAQAAPYVRQGVKLLEERGRLDSLMLANVVPCVLPEMTERMLDWSHAPREATMTHPEGFTEKIGLMKGRQRAEVRACGSCAERGSCLGVEQEYIERYGDGDFKALSRSAERVRT